MIPFGWLFVAYLVGVAIGWACRGIWYDGREAKESQAQYDFHPSHDDSPDALCNCPSCR